MHNQFLGVVCGLKSEARVVERAVEQSKIQIGVSGANARRAEQISTEFCHRGARAILSVGISGGLAPELKAGDLIIGSKVISDDGRAYSCDQHLLDVLRKRAAERRATVGSLFGSDEIIASETKKRALRHNHGAFAVDMESHGAAKASLAANVPFIAIRAIADPANRVLPEAALDAIAPDGSTKVFSTMLTALRRPQQIPELMSLGRDSDLALRRLRRDLGFFFSALFLSLDF